jgi:hypothetical protein
MTIETEITITDLPPAQTVGAKGTTKRAVRWTEGGDYPQTFEVEFWGKRCDMLSGLSIGSKAAIKAELRGREYNGRVYMSLSGINIEAVYRDESRPSAASEDLVPVGGAEPFGDEMPF